MKNLIGIILVLMPLSCSFEPYRKAELAEVRITVPPELLKAKAGVKAGPGDYSTVDCFLLDVNGPGIEPMYDEASPFAGMDLGLNSVWLQRTDMLANGTNTLSVRVPIGRSRTVRILAVTAVTGACSGLTFAGFPLTGVLVTPPYPIVNEVARATLDVFSGKAVATAELADRSEDMIPNNTLSVPGRAVLILGNTLSDFSEGAPSGGGFGTWTTPRSSGGIAGKARVDIVLDIDNQNVRPYRGLQIQVKADGGNVSGCGSATVLNASNLALGLWHETAFAWQIKPVFIQAEDQSLVYTANFTGLEFEKVRLAIDDGNGIFQSLYLSLRVIDAPASGCSAINVQSMSATLYQ